MKIRHCSQCQQHGLIWTGAFWACGVCRYAMTQPTLLIDQADTQSRAGAGRPTVDRGPHDLVTTTQDDHAAPWKIGR